MAEDGQSGLIISRQPVPISTSLISSSNRNGRSLKTPHSPLQALESVSGPQALDNDYCDLPPTKDLSKNNNTTPSQLSTHSIVGDDFRASDRQKSKFIIAPSEKSPKAAAKVLKVVKREQSRISDTSATSLIPLHVEGKGADLCSYCGLCRCERCRASNRLSNSWLCNSRCLCSPESLLEQCTCVCCVQGLFYHCAEDTEDDYRYADEPCSCNSHKRCIRFSAMGVLSMALPCLWCYWPGRACLECLRLCKAQGRKGCECVDKAVKV